MVVKAHVRVFRILPGRWGYLVTGLDGRTPFLGTAPTQGQALNLALAELRVPAIRRAP